MTNPSLLYTIAHAPAMDKFPAAPDNFQQKVRTYTWVVLARYIEERCLANETVYCLTGSVKEKPFAALKNEPEHKMHRN